jgi:hypothetical protein
MQLPVSVFSLLHTYGKDLTEAIRNVGAHPRYLLPSIDAVRLAVIGAISFRETRKRLVQHLNFLVHTVFSTPIHQFGLETYVTTILKTLLGVDEIEGEATADRVAKAVEQQPKLDEARFGHAESLFVSQLVLYHVPRLLPAYREKLARELEGRGYSIPVKAFCKWHKMVYPEVVRIGECISPVH